MNGSGNNYIQQFAAFQLPLVFIFVTGAWNPPTAALEAADPFGLISTVEKGELSELFTSLTPVFVNGDIEGFKSHLSEKISPERRAGIIAAMRAEFNKIKYKRFSVDAVTVTGRQEDRYEIRAECSFSYAGRDSRMDYSDSEVSWFFEVEKEPDGRFLFVDSPGLFDSIGLAGGRHDLSLRFYLAIISLLVGAFWLWMIVDSFHHLPPRWTWRIIVLALPVAGAIVYGLAELFIGRHEKGAQK